MTKPAVGQSVKRKEDPRLVTGRGNYVDDVSEPRHTLHMSILRSPYAHAEIKSVDASEAEALPGVVAVITGAQAAELVPPYAADYDKPGFKVTKRPVLAIDRARFVGDGIAAVLAENAYVAEDALALIEVDYGPLPSVSDTEDALAPDAPLVHADAGDNVLFAGSFKTDGFDEAESAAPHVIEERFRSNSTPGAGRYRPLPGLAGRAGTRRGAGRRRWLRAEDVCLSGRNSERRPRRPHARADQVDRGPA
jgi:carbon-monoxide dehydrogenase large subunit